MRSYSIYLWHWPIIVLSSSRFGLSAGGPLLLAVQVGLTAAAAELSFRLLEAPHRNGAFEWDRGGTPAATGERTVAQHRNPGRRDCLCRGSALAVRGGDVCKTSRGPGLSRDRGDLRRAHACPECCEPAGIRPTGRRLGRSDPVGDSAGSRPAAPWHDPAAITPASIERTASVAAASVPAGSGSVPPHHEITAVGDSVMLGAATELARELGSVYVDATLGRNADGVLQVLRDRQASGGLDSTVVVQVGNNGPLTATQLEQIGHVPWSGGEVICGAG